MSEIKLPKNVIIDDEEIWCQVFSSPNKEPDWAKGKPALFLDRDGVIVEEVNYLSRPEDMRLIEGAGKLIAACNSLNLPVVIVTNQSGVARGYFGWQEFAAVQQKMLDDLARLNATVDAVYACPHHKKGAAPYHIDNHAARKPNPGMLLRAHAALGMNLRQSWIIGDKAGDLGAGKNSGIEGGIHVLTGHGRDEGEVEKASALTSADFKTEKAASIADCHVFLPFLD